ncbi:hypothetical protein HanIR_Chr14g0698711 [Helianthus annuus]|nr:hypothetical protein HanIR_Chr14g0698711 [Helianthus annuus]
MLYQILIMLLRISFELVIWISFVMMSLAIFTLRLIPMFPPLVGV